MSNIPYSRAELENAKASIEKMKQSKNFVDYEKNWRDFLQYLERCWVKSERECQPYKNKFEPWQGTFTNLRKNDPLLSYLKNARDADQHSIEEILEKSEGYQTAHFVDSSGNPLNEGRIDQLVIRNGQIVSLQPAKGHMVKVETKPTKVEVLPVKNSGKVYTVPSYHRGKPIAKNTNPIKLALLGLLFYEDFLNQIEQKFFITK